MNVEERGQGLHGGGALDLYLREISGFPLLDRDEEGELAVRIRDGDHKALERLARSNLRFVVSVAKKYANQGISLLDLINEGNLGLLRAAYKFDETKGTKFISYAVWWIRQAILQALAEQSRTIRIPLNRAGILYRIAKESSHLVQELGREPTDDEIADGMGLSVSDIRNAMRISQSFRSLDAPIAPGEDGRLVDHIPDAGQVSPLEKAFSRALAETIEHSLSTLKEREAEILQMYFGLADKEPMTLEEIGRMMGITRERVRQIKEKAITRLRHVSRSRALRSFLN